MKNPIGILVLDINAKRAHMPMKSLLRYLISIISSLALSACGTSYYVRKAAAEDFHCEKSKIKVTESEGSTSLTGAVRTFDRIG